MAAYLPGQWYFYRHRDDFRQQAAVKSRHEGGRVVVWVDQRHLWAEGESEVVSRPEIAFKIYRRVTNHRRKPS